MRATRRGETGLVRARIATPGAYDVTRRLEVVQVDHTRLDVIIVDQASRETAGRPCITLAIDVMTRMVTGFHLGTESPSRTSIGLCVLHAVYDKTAWLAERRTDAPCPTAGLPEALHARPPPRSAIDSLTVLAEYEELIPMAAAPAPLTLDTPAPDFRLPRTDARTYTADDIAGDNGTVIVFICTHCPYVKAVIDRLVAKTQRRHGES